MAADCLSADGARNRIRAPCRQEFPPAPAESLSPRRRKAGKNCGGKNKGWTAEPRKAQRQKLMASVADVGGKPPSKLNISAPVVATEYMTTQEAAAYLKLSRQFLEGARYRGDGSGPAYIKLERAVRYRQSVLDAWMSANDSPVRYADQMSDTPAPNFLDPHSLEHAASAHAPLDGEDGDIASPLADAVQATGNGAAHDYDELPEVGDDPATTRLEPNRADINGHLYALFHPEFRDALSRRVDRDRDCQPEGRRRQYRAEGAEHSRPSS